mgnify:CR=1 FL=1
MPDMNQIEIPQSFMACVFRPNVTGDFAKA